MKISLSINIADDAAQALADQQNQSIGNRGNKAGTPIDAATAATNALNSACSSVVLRATQLVSSASDSDILAAVKADPAMLKNATDSAHKRRSDNAKQNQKNVKLAPAPAAPTPSAK